MKKICKAIVFMLIFAITLATLSSCQQPNGSSNSSSSSSSAPKEENVAVKNLVGNENYQTLLSSGALSESVVKKTGGNVSLKSVNTLGDHYVVLTFDGYIENFDASDVKFSSYTSDWYSLVAKTVDRIVVEDSAVGVNSDGETVAVFKIQNNITDVYLDSVFTAPTLSDEDKSTIITQADNAMTWQIPDNGGWDKDYNNHIKTAHTSGATYITKGWTANGKPLGTIDNDATYTHMELIAKAYDITGEQKYKDSFLKGLEFLKKLQYESGGFAQVYPRRGNYSDYVTFNDNAMINVLIMLQKVENGYYPYETIVTDEERAEISQMIDKAIDYILKSQISLSDGTVTGWCAQHDPVTYEPRGGRAYELPSISGSESVPVIEFLFNQRDNAAAVEAAKKALDWFNSDNVKLSNTNLNNKATEVDPETGKVKYFYYQEGKTIWYRFYQLGTGVGIFSDRDGGTYYDIADISEERRTGYSWAGNYAEKLISVYSKYGYYADKIICKISSSNSSVTGGTLQTSDFISADSSIK